jgi:cell division protein ZipA
MNIILVIAFAIAVVALSVVTVKFNQHKRRQKFQPELNNLDQFNGEDEDILSIRKVSLNHPQQEKPGRKIERTERREETIASDDIRVIHVMAKAPQEFQGYELLQTLLASGMRYGDMKIFHRHQHANGKGPILFSLASVTEPGTFDLQTIGDFSCKGFSLFMRLTHSAFDDERYQLMIDVAKQLAEDLGGSVCDANRQLLRV